MRYMSSFTPDRPHHQKPALAKAVGAAVERNYYDSHA